MFNLLGAVQNYAWGKKGLSSAVAQFYSSSNPSVQISNDTPYAELWFGGHPSGPSLLIETDQHGKELMRTLSEWIAEDPILRSGYKDGEFPYLLKILSIAQPLSIQAHPDKEIAKRLHHERPDIYKDPNHKPEIAVALTPFDALCGFRELGEIAFFIESVNELRDVIGEEESTEFLKQYQSNGKEALKKIWRSMLSRDKEFVKNSLQGLVDRIRSDGHNINDSRLKAAYQLLLRLFKDYPGDPGNFCAFLLNVLSFDALSSSSTTKIKSSALFMGANEPHAYLEGDLIECMACSDNVVRAGLTPKLVDVPTLCSMLTYKSGLPVLVEGVNRGGYVEYVPPAEEFRVDRYELSPGVSVEINPIAGPSIYLVLAGAGRVELDPQRSVIQSEQRKNVGKGTALYVVPKQKLSFFADATSKEPLLVFRASPNSTPSASL